MMQRLGIVGAALATIAYGWVASASFIYCKVAGKMALFQFPYWQWFDARPYWHLNPRMSLYVIGSAAAPSLVILLCVYGTIRHALTQRKTRRPFWQRGPRPLEEGASDNHGHSHWLDMEDAKELFPGPDPNYGGIVVGEAYRVDQDTVAKVRFNPRKPSTWGLGGKAPLLIDPCWDGPTHSIVFVGSGTFKSMSAIVTIMNWIGSSVILDPSTELGPMLDSALRLQGKRVFHIGIKSEPGIVRGGINVLDWIDITDPEAEKHVVTTASLAYDEDSAKSGAKSSDPFFTNMGRNLITCLLAHMLWGDDLDDVVQQEEKTLASIAIGLSMSEKKIIAILEGINAHSKSPLARRLAGTLMECRAPETFSGIYLSAVNGIGWLMIDAYADLVSTNSFDPTALLDGDSTIFLNISLHTLQNTPAIGRVLVGALMNTVYMAEPDPNRRILYLLDEVARLGRMEVLETARDAGRKNGITLHMLMQSIGQLEQIWGKDGMKSWIDGTSWVGYAAVRAGSVGKDLSEQLGTHAVLAYSEGSNKGTQKPWGLLAFGSKSNGSNTNVHEIKRFLMTASELQQDMRTDEMIIVPQSGMPIRCGRAIFFRRPELVDLVKHSAFARKEAA